MKLPLTNSLIAVALTAAAAGSAISTQHLGQTSPPTKSESVEMTIGEVRRVDKEQKKITLRHGEIKNLDMPSMSMVFNVRDVALLDKVAEGDKVRFRAEKVDGQFFVTAIEK